MTGETGVIMATTKNESGTVVEYALDAIRNSIKEGRYAPGQRLIEADLTRDLNVSRGPLREAMRRLAGDGLVKIEPHRGVIVRRLSRADVEGIYQVRESLEGLAARLAAENVKNGASSKLIGDSIRNMRAIAKNKDVTAYMNSNEDLHKLVVEMSGNEWLMDLVNQLRLPVFRLQFNRLLDPSAKDESLSGHEKVAAAVLAGDGTKAERAMKAHVRNSGRVLLELPEASFGL